MDKEKFAKKKLKLISRFIRPKSSVLDIGCGKALLRIFLKDCEYFGVDVDDKAVLNLKKQGIKAVKADINTDKIPFGARKFDYIILADVLECFVDPAKVLNQLKNRLKTNGRIIVSFPNDYHLLNKIRFVFDKDLTDNVFSPYGHLHYFPVKSGKKFLQKCGFRILCSKNVAPEKPNVVPGFIKNMLSEISPSWFARCIIYVLAPAEQFKNLKPIQHSKHTRH